MWESSMNSRDARCFACCILLFLVDAESFVDDAGEES